MFSPCKSALFFFVKNASLSEDMFIWGNYSANLKFCTFIKNSSNLNQFQMINDWTNYCPSVRNMWELVATKTGSYCKHVNNSSCSIDNAVSAVLSELDNIASRRAENSNKGFSLLPAGTGRCLAKQQCIMGR